jgi:hypothetical protein
MALGHSAPTIQVDFATTGVLWWDAHAHDIGSSCLCGFVDRHGERIVHHAAFQATDVVRRSGPGTGYAPTHHDVMRAIIAHSDLRATNHRGQNALHTHASNRSGNAHLAFFECLRDMKAARARSTDASDIAWCAALRDALTARDIDGNTILNTASIWTLDEDDAIVWDTDLLRLLSRDFDDVACTVAIPNDLRATPLSQYLSILVTPDDVDIDYLRWLIGAGANVSDRDVNGRTLLHICGELSTPELDLVDIARHALDARVHPGLLDEVGHNALHTSAFNRACPESVIALLLAHSQPGILGTRDSRGHTPERIARANGNERVANLLRPSASRRRDATIDQ